MSRLLKSSRSSPAKSRRRSARKVRSEPRGPGGRPPLLTATEAAELLTLSALYNRVKAECSPGALCRRFGLSLTTVRSYEQQRQLWLKDDIGAIAASMKVVARPVRKRSRITAQAMARYQ